MTHKTTIQSTKPKRVALLTVLSCRVSVSIRNAYLVKTQHGWITVRPNKELITAQAFFSVFTKQEVALRNWLKLFSDGRTKGGYFFLCSSEAVSASQTAHCCAQLSCVLSFVAKWRRHTLHHILKQFIKHHHISENRTTQPFRPYKAKVAARPLFLCSTRLLIHTSLLHGVTPNTVWVWSRNLGALTGGGQCTALPVATSRNSQRAFGCLWPHVQTVHKLGQNSARSWTATGASIHHCVRTNRRILQLAASPSAASLCRLVHLCHRYPTHINNLPCAALRETGSLKDTYRSDFEGTKRHFIWRMNTAAKELRFDVR